VPDVTVRPPQLLCRLFFGYHPANTQVVVGLLLEAVVTEAPRNAPGAAAPRVEDTPRGEMLMPHSEPVADANDLDLPREVHIELQQMVEDAQQEEDRNPAPPSQPTAGSTPFAPGAGGAACCAAPSARTRSGRSFVGLCVRPLLYTHTLTALLHTESDAAYHPAPSPAFALSCDERL